METIFEIGAWVSTEDGLGQILFNRRLYIEEYSFAAKEGKKGELDRVIYICKILCDLNGNIKSRHPIRSYTSVQLLNEEEEKLVKLIKKSFPDSFVDYIVSESKDILTRQIFLTYKIENEKIDEAIDKINFINKNLRPLFTFKEFAKEFRKSELPFSCQDFYRKGQSYNRSEVITLRFDSYLYRTKGKEAVFNNVTAIKA